MMSIAAIRNGFWLYYRYMVVSIQSQLEYPNSFIMLSISQFLNTVVEFGGIWALFTRFGTLGGWTLAQIAFFYGTVNVAFALSDALNRGFDVFGPEYVKTGNFDRILLRPRSTILQLLGHQFVMHRVGRLLQAAIILGVAITILDIDWSLWKAVLLFFTIAGGIAFFLGLFVLGGTLAFWTVESLEIMNTVTYGGVEAGQYPVSIYKDWFQKFLIYVVPLATISHFPIVAILGVPDPLGSPLWFQIMAPGIGFLFLMLTFRVWRFGVSHYTSTGS